MTYVTIIRNVLINGEMTEIEDYAPESYLDQGVSNTMGIEANDYAIMSGKNLPWMSHIDRPSK